MMRVKIIPLMFLGLLVSGCWGKDKAEEKKLNPEMGSQQSMGEPSKMRMARYHKSTQGLWQSDMASDGTFIVISMGANGEGTCDTRKTRGSEEILEKTYPMVIRGRAVESDGCPIDKWLFRPQGETLVFTSLSGDESKTFTKRI
jgi:hypothetical protein